MMNRIQDLLTSDRARLLRIVTAHADPSVLAALRFMAFASITRLRIFLPNERGNILVPQSAVDLDKFSIILVDDEDSDSLEAIFDELHRRVNRLAKTAAADGLRCW